MCNNRGTEVSQGHQTLDVLDDAEQYWSFSFETFAGDLIANAKAMNESAGTGKGWYFGMSLGTIQALVALSL